MPPRDTTVLDKTLYGQLTKLENGLFPRSVSESGASSNIVQAYELAKQRYADLGVDTDAVCARLKTVSISLHCWQGDDVGGFEGLGESLSGGIAVTGNYPGRARTPDELRNDLEHALSLIPGEHRLNLHAFYGEFDGKKVDRDQIEISHFQGWMDWAKERGLGLDFNPTFFSHKLANDGMTLSHPKEYIRNFWLEHAQRCRSIGAEMGKQLGSPCVNNVWIPDGMKDTPVDRAAPRARLMDSLDRLFAVKHPQNHLLDAVECKLFGIGSESYVVGSHEFYLGYAVTRQKMLCLDAGHFHPTETISDKLSSVLNFVPELLLHVSRGVRWDSDHVVILNDELQAIAQELVRGELLSRTHIGLDFFDASINRIAAWVIGTRAMIKALLMAMLEPIQKLRSCELAGDFTMRLALLEELKSLPFGAVWDYYCFQQEVPVGTNWINEIKSYETKVLSQR